MTQPSIPAQSVRADAGAVLVGMVFPTLVTWLYFVALRHCPSAVQQTAYARGKSLQFAFPLLWVFVLRPRWLRGNNAGGGQQTPVASSSARAMPRPARLAGIVQGLAFGAVIFAAILSGWHVWLQPAGFMASATAAMAQKVSAFGVTSPAGFAAMAIFYALVHSFLEEYYWRWFVFGQLQRLLPLPAAIVLSSLAFTVHHVIVLAAYFGWRSPATLIFSLGVAAGGAVWAWIYHRSGSLLGPWLSHALVDAAIFAVGYQLLRGVLGW